MADRTDFFYRMLVGEADLDLAFDQLETADRRIMSDLGLSGVMSGLGVTQNSPTGLSVIVAAGTAYTPQGERVRIPGAQTVDISEDYLGAATDVTVVGQARWISIFLLADRDLTDPQTDGGGNTVFVQRGEAFALRVVQGAQGLSPSKPALLSDGILLADVQLAHGDTAVTNSDLDTNRRQNLFVVSGAPLGLNHTSFAAAFGQILSIVNGHLTGATNQHGADDIVYVAGSGDFADGVTSLPSLTSVEDTFTTFVEYLAEKATNPSGADLIGVRQDASVSPTLPAGTVFERLVALRDAANLRYGGSPNWLDSTSVAAGTVEAGFDGIVSALTSTSGLRGAGKVSSLGATQSPTSLASGSVHDHIVALLTAVNDRARKQAAETISAQYTFDRGGGGGTGLSTSATTTADFNGPVQVDDITATGTNRYKYASRSITRVQPAPLYNGNSNAWSDGEKVSVGATHLAVQALRFANGSVLNSITFYHNRTDSGALPDTRVSGSVTKVNLSTGAATIIGSVTVDPTSTIGPYEAYHGFSISGLSEDIDTTTFKYYASFNGESGTNATSTLWYGTVTAVTVTAQDEAPT